MRDHYYQLWDLEKNFGEKTLCNDQVPDKLNANKNLEKTLFGGIMARKFRYETIFFFVNFFDRKSCIFNETKINKYL